MNLRDQDILLSKEKLLELLKRGGSETVTEENLQEFFRLGAPVEKDGRVYLKRFLAWLVDYDNEKRK